MNIKEWEDICISFDEYGMQPATLCDNDEEVINNFKKAFKNVFKDLEEKELLETYLKLEKDKVKYIMKQLKNQDKILWILFKKNVDIELLKLSTNYIDYYIRVKHRTGNNTELLEEEYKFIKE